MTAGAHDAGGGFGRSAGVNTARGIGVILVAVVVGLLLMREGLAERTEAAATTDTTEVTTDESDQNLVTDPDADADADAADDAVVEETTTTTEAAVARPPAEVKVLVLNGTNGIQGVAGRGTAVVTDAGYIGAEPKNAEVDGPSVVLYVEGYEADARAVAAAFGVDPDAVIAPFDAATSPIADTQSANIIVRVGNDGVIQV